MDMDIDGISMSKSITDKCHGYGHRWNIKLYSEEFVGYFGQILMYCTLASL
jgi:hypothetical protein